MSIGFVGIGRMGWAMARNLLKAGTPLTVWNRSPGKGEELERLGATRAASVDDLFTRCSTVLMMLLNEAVIDDVLARGTPLFAARLAGTTLVHLGTTSPEYSAALAHEVHAAGGSYVEAPVSGSRVPAEEGRLVGMVAGNDDAVERVLPLLAPLCASVFRCGAVPGALRMKLAANHFLIGMVTVLAETVHAARLAGVDVETLRQVLDAGPMASAVSCMKLDKLVRNDFSPQAAVRDVSTIACLVAAQCARAAADAPLIRRCAELYRTADEAGHGDHDMVAVVHAFAGTSTDAKPLPTTTGLP